MRLFIEASWFRRFSNNPEVTPSDYDENGMFYGKVGYETLRWFDIFYNALENWKSLGNPETLANLSGISEILDKSVGKSGNSVK